MTRKPEKFPKACCLFTASILLCGAFAGQSLQADEIQQTRRYPNEATPLREAFGQGLNLNFVRGATFDPATDPVFYLQEGKVLNKEDVKKQRPKCKVSLDSPIKEYITRYSFTEGQPLIMQLEKSWETSFSLFGKKFGSGFELVARGVFEDAKSILKPNEFHTVGEAENNYNMQKLKFECSDFPYPLAFGDFEKTVNGEMFKVDAKKWDPSQLTRRSVSGKLIYEDMQRMEARFKATMEREEAERKAKLEADKKRALEEARAAAGTRANQTTLLSDLLKGDAVEIADQSIEALLPRREYIGSIHQGGVRVGATDPSAKLYEFIGKLLDAKAPYCTIIPMSFRAGPEDKFVALGAGFYTMDFIRRYESNKSKILITLKGRDKAELGTTPEFALSCENATTVADVEGAIGRALSIYVKSPSPTEAAQSVVKGLQDLPHVNEAPAASQGSSVQEAVQKSLEPSNVPAEAPAQETSVSSAK